MKLVRKTIGEKFDKNEILPRPMQVTLIVNLLQKWHNQTEYTNIFNPQLENRMQKFL